MALEEIVHNYYEYLDVPQDASPQTIQQAFSRLMASTQEKLNNPFTMKSARDITNTIIPGIRQHLLTGEEERARYDRQLAAYQAAQARRAELADEARLDELLRRPFFFDPLKGYDTETPALTLRQIASKLDEEWPRACEWLTDTSSKVHAFTGFLKYTVGHAKLAERIDTIIRSANRAARFAPDVHRAIERCIMTLDPEVARPGVRILNPTFDGRTLDAGEYIADLPAQAELILGHEGFRGCAFGRIESTTPWVTFAKKASYFPFTLLPAGTDPAVGQSEIHIPLVFLLDQLEHNTDHSAELTIFLENFKQPRTFSFALVLHILPTPPRVIFNPSRPLAAPVRQGAQAYVSVTALNRSPDEKLSPLAGTIRAREPGTSAAPSFFHHNTRIDFMIDTSPYPRGKPYAVIFEVNYGAARGTQGPTTLEVRGELLPSPWQSLQRVKQLSDRVSAGVVGGFVGLCIFLLLGLAFAGVWPFLLFPPIFLGASQLIWRTIIAHRELAGEAIASLSSSGKVYTRLGVSAGLGLAFALVCALIGSAAPALLSLIGTPAGFVTAFMLDRTSFGTFPLNR